MFITVADQSGSNGFESDNNNNGTNLTPKTSAVFSNVTVLGPCRAATGGFNANYQNGLHLRRNSSISLLNSVIAGFPIGLYIDDTLVETAGATSTNFTGGQAVIANNLIYGTRTTEVRVSTAGLLTAIDASLRANNSFVQGSFGSTLFVAPYLYTTDFGAAATSTLGTADFTVTATSAAATGALFTNAKVSAPFFTRVAFEGAFGTVNWAAGWAQVDAQVLAYTTPGKVLTN